MNYEIVELESLSGQKTKIYSVIFEEDHGTLFEHFISENIKEYRQEIKSILNTLQLIGNITGARDSMFKYDEGIPGDGVCALFDQKQKRLRLFCIKYGNIAIILGGGGIKNVRAWQDDKKLSREATMMIKLSADIMDRLRNGDLKWDNNELVET